MFWDRATQALRAEEAVTFRGGGGYGGRGQAVGPAKLSPGSVTAPSTEGRGLDFRTQSFMVLPMAATASIRIVKHGDYKGGTREWGNRYHFSGGTPADLSHWTTLAGNVRDAEIAALAANQVMVKWIGYGPGSDEPVASGTLSGSGALTVTSPVQASPLEVSALLRWSTDQRSSKNHPIYLFSYIRGALRQTDVENDALGTAMKTALTTYGNAWVTGFSDGANTYHRAGPNGAVALGVSVPTYVTHRDFPR